MIGKYSHVVILGIDGAGAYFRETDTPNLDRILADGSCTYEGMTASPSISAECWGSLLHGVTPAFHRLTNALVGAAPYPGDSLYPSVFRVLHEARPEAVMASFSSWGAINTGIIEQDIGVYTETSDTVSEDYDGKPDSCADDFQLTDKIVSYIENGNRPELLFVQFDRCDSAGHRCGYGGERHLRTIRETDAMIGRIFDAYARMGMADDTLFIITADHGGIRGGYFHGGNDPDEMKILIGVSGRTVKKGQMGNAEIRDIASVALYALGIEQPKSWTSRIPDGVFDGIRAAERPREVFPDGIRLHTSVPTPKGGLMKLFGGRLFLYLPFDNHISDITGHHKTFFHGKIYFPDGYHGTGVRLDDGFVEAEGFDPGVGSLTVGLWLKDNGITGIPSVFSNQAESGRSKTGFMLMLENQLAHLSIGNGENRLAPKFAFPDFPWSWLHILLCINEEENKVTLWADFKKIFECGLDGWQNVTRSSAFPLRLGQDAEAKRPPLCGTIDDFFVLKGNLTEEEIRKLAAYYGKSV